MELEGGVSEQSRCSEGKEGMEAGRGGVDIHVLPHAYLCSTHVRITPLQWARARLHVSEKGTFLPMFL